MEQTSDLIETTEPGAVSAAESGPTQAGTPAGRIRSLVAEAEARGTPMVSAQAMQAKLFTVYDDAGAVPEALALVQRHLGLTLDRTWYSAEEIGQLADQLDWLLGLGAPEAAAAPAETVPAETVPAEDGVVPGELGAASAVTGTASPGTE